LLWASYFFVLTLLLSIPLKRPATQPREDEKWSSWQLWSPEEAGLFMLAAAFTLAQSYFLDWPILSGPDEPVLIEQNLHQWQAFSSGDPWYALFLAMLGVGIAYTVL
jgi:hypothetical protein